MARRKKTKTPKKPSRYVGFAAMLTQEQYQFLKDLAAKNNEPMTAMLRAIMERAKSGQFFFSSSALDCMMSYNAESEVMPAAGQPAGDVTSESEQSAHQI